VCFGIVGCGSSGSDVSGEVTFAGKPVPAGRIYFNPDFSKNNNGPQGFAEIIDGRFDTRAGGHPACGGPTVVLIRGNDGGSDPVPLFDGYQVALDLPTAASVQEFAVPESAAKKVSKSHRSGRRP
jgi:hypothetical protein